MARSSANRLASISKWLRGGHAPAPPALDANVEPRNALAEVAAACARGLYGDALAIADRARAAFPDDPRLAFARVSTLLAWGRVAEATPALIEVAHAGDVAQPDWLPLAHALLAAGRADLAEEWYRKAIPTGSEAAARGLVAALFRAGRVDAAIAQCEAILARHPADSLAQTLLGQCRFAARDLDAAEACFRRALEFEPSLANARLGLGIVLRIRGRFHEAIAELERARDASADRGVADGLVDLALALQASGRLGEALRLLERHLPDNPIPEAHRTYGQLLLSAGRMEEGWCHHEFRWFIEPLLSTRSIGRWPVWDGQDLRGKTILLRIEQGVGDTIQFVRYAPWLQSLGAKVVLRHSELAGTFAGVDRVIRTSADMDGIDFYANLLSLPKVFATDLDTIPASIPYVAPPVDRQRSWRRRLASGNMPRVGIVWAGNPAHPADAARSVAASLFLPLLATEGIRFFSLQKGDAAQGMRGIHEMGHVVDLEPELTDFSEAAAAIAQLDLLICVDTAVAHLAGAMGKPVWVMLPKPCDWRWMEARTDTPWYPSMRLFRQHVPGDWRDVIDRVRAALELWRSLPRGDSPDIIRLAPQRQAPAVVDRPAWGWRPGLSAATDTAVGLMQYLPDEPDIGPSLTAYGEYLRLEVGLIESRILPGSTIVEADAGIGFHSIALARLVGPDGRVLAYETRPRHRKILQHNLAANGVRNVTVMQRMLGGPSRDLSAPRTLDMETLDELQLDALAWLKLDQPRSTLDVLEGGRDVLWRLRPRVMMRSADAAVMRELASRLRDHGFRCWHVAAPLFNPRNFKCRTADVFVGRAVSVLLAVPEEQDIALDSAGCVEMP